MRILTPHRVDILPVAYGVMLDAVTPSADSRDYGRDTGREWTPEDLRGRKAVIERMRKMSENVARE